MFSLLPSLHVPCLSSSVFSYHVVFTGTKVDTTGERRDGDRRWSVLAWHALDRKKDVSVSLPRRSRDGLILLRSGEGGAFGNIASERDTPVQKAWFRKGSEAASIDRSRDPTSNSTAQNAHGEVSRGKGHQVAHPRCPRE